MPPDNARQDYFVCEKGVWNGVEVAFGKDYGLDCEEFVSVDSDKEKNE